MRYTLPILSFILPLSYTLPQGSPNEKNQCSSFDSSGYFCVPYYLCDATGYIITDGGGIFNPRTSDTVQVVNHEDALQSSCDKLIHVCCRHPDTKNNKLDLPTSKPPVDPEPFKPKCGNRNEGGVGVQDVSPQIQDEEAQFGEWPHVCAVLKEEALEGGDTVNIYQCAGSLISEGVVLTAAHCVKNAKDTGAKLIVRCGEWDTLADTESLPHQEQNVQETFIHPDYTEKNLHNNFALLITEHDFLLAPHISPVCLPSPQDQTNPQNCVSNGWGKDQFGSKGEYQTKLKEIQLPLVDNEKCEKQLRTTRLGQFFQLDDSFMCAGGGEADTCKGDGGGPLTCRHEGSSTYTQVGIVSWGIGCGQKDVPAVYANVAKAACWIDKTVSCHLENLAIETFGASPSSFVPSHFGFTRDDCPGEYAPGKCPDDGSTNYNSDDADDDYEPYDYDARDGDGVESDIFGIDTL